MQLCRRVAAVSYEVANRCMVALPKSSKRVWVHLWGFVSRTWIHSSCCVLALGKNCDCLVAGWRQGSTADVLLQYEELDEQHRLLNQQKLVQHPCYCLQSHTNLACPLLVNAHLTGTSKCWIGDLMHVCRMTAGAS